MLLSVYNTLINNVLPIKLNSNKIYSYQRFCTYQKYHVSLCPLNERLKNTFKASDTLSFTDIYEYNYIKCHLYNCIFISLALTSQFMTSSPMQDIGKNTFKMNNEVNKEVNKKNCNRE